MTDTKVTVRDEDNTKSIRSSAMMFRRSDLFTKDFYSNENWFEHMCEVLFHIQRRNVTIKSEIYCGLIQFISCVYVLAVIPQQLENAGFNPSSTVCATALVCGVGSIVCGLFANLPFIIAPPTAVGIFYSIYVQQQNMSVENASFAVMLSGIFILLLGFRPFGSFFSHFIPSCIQMSVAVGIGLFTALAGATDIDLVVPGEYTIVAMGTLTKEVIVSLAGVVLIATLLSYHVKASFCISLVLMSLLWWCMENEWPYAVFEAPSFTTIVGKAHGDALLCLDLFFLIVLFLNGLIISLSDLGKLVRDDGTIPRSRWIFVVCGLSTILSGYFCGAPVLISPESGAGVKAGAKTGLSTVVAGILFLLSMFLSPIFQSVPGAATSGVLILIGALLFQNVLKVDWHNPAEAVPCFCTLFFIVSTYSILQGTGIGVVLFLIINLLTGDLEIIIRRQFNKWITPIQSNVTGGHGDGYDNEGELGTRNPSTANPSIAPEPLVVALFKKAKEFLGNVNMDSVGTAFRIEDSRFGEAERESEQRHYDGIFSTMRLRGKSTAPVTNPIPAVVLKNDDDSFHSQTSASSAIYQNMDNAQVTLHENKATSASKQSIV